MPPSSTDDPRSLASFSVPGRAEAPRHAALRVVGLAAPFALPVARLDGLETAVAEAVSNAIEHGNLGDPRCPVHVGVRIEGGNVVVRVTDGGHGAPPTQHVRPPDLAAKLRGEGPLRGWGRYLMQHLVDEVRVPEVGGPGGVVELVVSIPSSTR